MSIFFLVGKNTSFLNRKEISQLIENENLYWNKNTAYFNPLSNA